LVARLGLGLSLVAGVILASVPLQLAAQKATGTMTVTAVVRPACAIRSTSTPGMPVRLSCPASTSSAQINYTANGVNIDF
jgi:hypothetical protein